jgi:NAD(P)-dependent dehydrogenase (short-subunit alcohol dehydrogenase family)
MSGRVVWITGASSGIGEALARRLAADGDRVAVSARSEDKLQAMAAGSGQIEPFPADATDPEAIARTLAAIEQRLGPVEIAVLAAGTHQPVSAEDFKAAELARLLEVNVVGVANCLEALMPRMIARKRGEILIVSSVAGYRGLPSSAYYGATKAALINLAESLKFDLDKHGVRMRLIDPGFVKTPLTDKNEFAMPFLIEAEEAARRIARGLGRAGFEITFPKRFTSILKVLRCLPYRLYFPIVARATRK